MYSCYSAEGQSWHKRIYIQCSVVVQLRGGDMYSCYSAEGQSWHKRIYIQCSVVVQLRGGGGGGGGHVQLLLC